MTVRIEDLEPLLLRVEKPARYLGGEFNVARKDEAEVEVRCCLAFPDVYDLGMSYHGYNLLYERINRRPNWAAERVFTPWPDFDALLREHEIPLFSLESRRPLNEFDVVGFTLQHEVNYTNILSMLDLGGVPIESEDRTEPFPLIVGGGEGAFSPETMAPFIDVFVIGDGEGALDEIMETAEKARAEGWSRTQLLETLAPRPGMYVPEFYDVAYNDDGTVASVTPNRECAPPSVKKRHFNVTDDEGSVRPVVPLLRTVHDRFAIEIRRGCTNGCRFCQAGMITRPVRERSVDQIVDIARQGIENTGYDEISLLSLSSADYTSIGTLVRRISKEFPPGRISVSLPSLRINAFDVDLADEIRGVRKSGFTFAPEAGTARLRRVINKEVDQQDFFRIIGEVFARGWQTVKFYFMLGLPTETEEDLDGIVEICKEAMALGRKHHGRRAIVNVTLSPFVPKSNTPFQWEPQLPEEQMEKRYQYVRRALRGTGVDIKTSDPSESFIEAVLSRGDRRVAMAVKRAWELGCKFDGWGEYFRYDLWIEAFLQMGLNPRWYANRTRREDEVLPFDHIDASLGKRFLWADQRRAWRERVMEDCAVGKCAGCVACDDEIDHILAKDQPGGAEGLERYPAKFESREEKEKRLAEGRQLGDPSEESMLRAAASRYRERREQIIEEAIAKGEEEDQIFTRFQSAPKYKPAEKFVEPPRVQRIRVTYTKLGVLRYLAHLDMSKVISLILRRARAPISYSEGFNSKPRVQFPPPLGLGVGGDQEKFDVMLLDRVDPEAFWEELRQFSIPGLEFLAAEEIEMSAPSLEAQVEASRFRLTIDEARSGLSRAQAEAALAEFESAESFPAQVMKKKRVKSIDLKHSLKAVGLEGGRDNAYEVRLEVSHEPGSFVKPEIALGLIAGRPLELGEGVRVEREELVLQGEPAAASAAASR